MTSSLAIIAPVCNEAQVIGEFVHRVSESLLNSGIVGWRIIFVDDGSTDSSLKVLESVQKHGLAPCHIIRHPVNLGLEAAIVTGLKQVQNEIVIVMDTDLQDPPELIPQIYNCIINGEFDLVVCKRKSRESDSFVKKSSAWLFYRTIKLISLQRELDLDSGNFRGLGINLTKDILVQNSRQVPFRLLSSLLAERKKILHYQRDSRFAGQTKYRLRDLFDEAFNSLFAINNNLLILGIFQLAFSVLGINQIRTLNITSEFPEALHVMLISFFLLNLLSSLLIMSYYTKIRFRKRCSQYLSKIKETNA